MHKSTTFTIIMDKSYQEFKSKEQQLKFGYLILIDNQVFHFDSKKDWEKVKETYPRSKLRFIATDLEKWHQRFM